jgi:hypothetical protein
VSALSVAAGLGLAAGPARWKPALVLSAGATGAALLVALAGTAGAVPGATWPRFWATLFFVLLLWPVGLGLLGRLFGLRVEAAAAAVLVLATVAQQSGQAEVPLPAAVSWWATLSAPADAVRHRISVPACGSAAWERAWSRASRAAVFVCAGAAATPQEIAAGGGARPAAGGGVTLAAGGQAAMPLTSVEQFRVSPEVSWYARPVSATEVRSAAASGGTLDVVLRRDGAEGAPLRLCGGRDDPTRPGAGGSERWHNGRWSAADLADRPLPLVEGRPVLGRYYIELRFLDAAGRPTIDIWY